MVIRFGDPNRGRPSVSQTWPVEMIEERNHGPTDPISGQDNRSQIRRVKCRNIDEGNRSEAISQSSAHLLSGTNESPSARRQRIPTQHRENPVLKWKKSHSHFPHFRRRGHHT